jgi:hypothetical protein
MAKLVEVIVSSECIGLGTPESPTCRVNRFYEPQTGELLGESEDIRGLVGLACKLDQLAREFDIRTRTIENPTAAASVLRDAALLLRSIA